VKAMREAEDDDMDQYSWFGEAPYPVENYAERAHACFHFLFPHSCESISMPVRIPVYVRGPVLQELASLDQ
jgi:hypothetical protein